MGRFPRLVILGRRSRDDRGSLVVEFGLLAPILLLLVFGIVDFGWAQLQASMINNASRDAARVASLSGSYEQVQSTIDTELTSAGIQPEDVTVNITCTNAVGASCDGTAASYNANATSGSTVTVTVSYTHGWVTPLGATCALVGSESCVGTTIVLRRTAQMVRE